MSWNIKRLPSGDRVQVALEIATIGTLVAVCGTSLVARDFKEALVLFCIALIIGVLAKDRIVVITGREDDFRQIEPRDRQGEFDNLVRSPTQWMFRGGTGRWFRSVAVPAVAKSATTSAPVRALLLDPRDERACAAYARYRVQSNWYKDHTVTPRGVQAEILATVLQLMKMNTTTRVRAQIALTSSYGPSRYDANQELMIVTTPDRAHPPLRVWKRHWFYDVILDEVAEAIANGPTLRLAKVSADIRTPDEAKAALDRVQVTMYDGERVSTLLDGYAASDVDWNLVVAALGSHGEEDEGRRAQ